MFSFLKRLWPFVSKKEHQELVQSYLEKLEEMESKVLDKDDYWEVLMAQNNMKLRDQLAKAEKEVEESSSRVKEYEDRLIRFQKAFEKRIREYCPVWHEIAQKAIRYVEDRDHILFAAITKPKIRLADYEEVSFSSMPQNETVKMVEFSIQMGLSKAVPPELIVREIIDQIGSQLESSILDQWENQSILFKV